MGSAKCRRGAGSVAMLALLAVAAGLLGACYGGHLVATMTPEQRARMEQEQAQQEAERQAQELRSPHYHADYGQWEVRCDRDPMTDQRPCFLRASLERHPVLGPTRGYVYVTPEAHLIAVHAAYVTALMLRVDEYAALPASACAGANDVRRYCLLLGDAARLALEQLAHGHRLYLRIETPRGVLPTQVDLSGYAAALASYQLHRRPEQVMGQR
ncbi:MAG TPA: hypothetical protein VL359_05225 [bacterium]|nr:hypothetical protein [bacterium]